MQFNKGGKWLLGLAITLWQPAMSGRFPLLRPQSSCSGSLPISPRSAVRHPDPKKTHIPVPGNVKWRWYSSAFRPSRVVSNR